MPDELEIVAAARSAALNLKRNDRCDSIMRGFFSGLALRERAHAWPGLSGPSATTDQVDHALATTTRGPVTGWKRPLKRQFLIWQYRGARQFLDRVDAPIAGVWNGIKGQRALFVQAARDLGKPVVFFEDAPLPGRVSVDLEGVNYGASTPQDPAFYRAWAEGRDDLSAWRRLRTDLVARKGRNAGQDQADLPDTPFVFVPLQVPSDTQVTVHGGWIGSVAAMIEVLGRVREALPEGWHLRLKEHPSSRTSLSDRLAKLAGPRLVIDNRTDTFAQVGASRAVLTLNSSVGLQSFFHDRPVITLGKAFYSMPGVTMQADSEAQLAALLGAPEAWSFDPSLRDAAMSYYDAVQFPSETDVRTGRWTLPDLVARDRGVRRIAARLPRPERLTSR